MAALWCMLALLSTLFTTPSVGAVDAPAPEPDADDLDLDPEFDALSFLDRQGVTNYGEILYHKRTDNISLCLQRDDAKERVFQMCTGRAVFEDCSHAGESFWFDRCSGTTCVETFSPEMSFCLLEASGALRQLNETLNQWICDVEPEMLPTIFEWNPPPWMAVVGLPDQFACMTAMPENGRFERRVVCENGRPIVEYRVVFNSESFLRTNERTVSCVAQHECGLPTIFAGEFSCYVAMDAQVETTSDSENDPPNGLTSHFVSFHMLCISFILLFFAV